MATKKKKRKFVDLSRFLRPPRSKSRFTRGMGVYDASGKQVSQAEERRVLKTLYNNPKKRKKIVKKRKPVKRKITKRKPVKRRVVKRKPIKKAPARKMAYFIINKEKKKGQFLALIAKQGIKGYYITSMELGRTKKIAQAWCDRANRKMKLLKKQVQQIILSTFPKK